MRTLGWYLLAVSSAIVGLYAVALVASGFAFLPADIAANSLPWWLRVHIAASGWALLLGPWQFRARLRQRHLRLHRVMGAGYVAACLVGGAAATASALGTTHGPVAASGFLCLAVAWLVTTATALRRILAGDVDGHRRWMVRSYSLTFAAVTLRLYLGAASALGADYDTVYPVIAWLCWVPNLVIVLAATARGAVSLVPPAPVER